ncbi:MAG: 2-oxo acid dehydrogenase subunit E2 [Holosporales bacterium]|jgi:pyruvate dehydrogenase E2 component (dihydrolipoamide acetyltransferase)|nr:2-oxo acid dehydrogenase subunit E2 [Holosporales bacterium]
MPLKINMPMLSPTMEKGNIVAWRKTEGDSVEVGDVVLDVDTDKATMEVEATYAGTLEKILTPAGSRDVPVKTTIAILRQRGDSDDDVARIMSEITPVPGVCACAPNTASRTHVIVDAPKDVSVISASPLARKIANEYGIDISKIPGSGPGSRVVRADVEKAIDLSNSHSLEPTESASPYVDAPPSNIRKIIAEKLTKSKQDVPHFYLNVSADITSLIKIREEINSGGVADTKITVNDLVIKATALALSDHPDVNVAWSNGQIRKFSNVDISVAVSVDDGLITPVVRRADRKSVVEISHEIKRLAQLAKTKSLTLQQIAGGGITVSNLGMYGVDHFFAIINSQQGSILSIGKADTVPMYNERGEIVAAQMLRIGHAVDHRVIDGAVAAKFLSSLVTYLQNPLRMLICQY